MASARDRVLDAYETLLVEQGPAAATLDAVASAAQVSKGGLLQMTRQIAVEHGKDGILCNSVSPGKIVTGTPGDLSADEAGLAYVRSRTPFSRLGRAEDVAAAVAYMASEASYTSGANLMVDGGWMAY